MKTVQIVLAALALAGCSQSQTYTSELAATKEDKPPVGHVINTKRLTMTPVRMSQTVTKDIEFHYLLTANVAVGYSEVHCTFYAKSKIVGAGFDNTSSIPAGVTVEGEFYSDVAEYPEVWVCRVNEGQL